MLTIYAATNMPPFLIGAVRDLRAVWAAEELGLPYRLHWLDVRAGEPRADWYRALNPFAKVPALDDGGVHVFESAAIVCHMADKARRLIPAPGTPERAAHDQWLFAALNTVEPPVFQVFVHDFAYGGLDGAAAFRARAVETARDRLASLDAVLATRAHVAGEDFAAADIVMTHVLAFVRDEALLGGLPHLTAYRARCMARPAYRRALAIQTEGKPA